LIECTQGTCNSYACLRRRHIINTILKPDFIVRTCQAGASRFFDVVDNGGSYDDGDLCIPAEYHTGPPEILAGTENYATDRDSDAVRKTSEDPGLERGSTRCILRRGMASVHSLADRARAQGRELEGVCRIRKFPIEKDDLITYSTYITFDRIVLCKSNPRARISTLGQH
jgi:hypothetical protein